MAEKTKKKVTKKSTTTSKKSIQEKPKKTASTKKVEKKSTVKKSKKTEVKTPKKVVKKSQENKKHPSENVSKVNKETTHKTLAIVTGVIMIILLLIFISMKSTTMTSLFSSNTAFTAHENATVIIIEDSTCQLCDVDTFIQGIKTEIEPSANIIRLEYTSDDAKKFIEKNSLNQVPVVIFSTHFENNVNWEQLKVAFNNISYNDEEFYVLTYNTPQIKKILEEPAINENTIISGNLDSKTTVYEICSFDVALCALVHGNSQYLEEVKQYTPEYVALYPGIKEDAKIITLHISNEETSDAYVAAFCANEQNKYDEFSSALYNNQFEWVPLPEKNSLFSNYALQVGINVEEFNTCLTQKKEEYTQQVAFETSLAQSYGIVQGPTFIVNNYVIQGPLDFTSYQTISNE